MFRTKSNIALLVFLFVVVAERVTPRLSLGFVKPALGHDPANCLDPHGSRATPLIRNNHRLELSVAQMVLVALAGDVVLVHPVLRQDADRSLIAALAKLVDVVG